MIDKRTRLAALFAVSSAFSLLGCAVPSERTVLGSCAGRCGSYDESNGCGCDPLCEHYRDCCDDYMDICLPDKDQAGGSSPTCVPASGASNTCSVPVEDLGTIVAPRK